MKSKCNATFACQDCNSYNTRLPSAVEHQYEAIKDDRMTDINGFNNDTTTLETHKNMIHSDTACKSRQENNRRNLFSRGVY